MVRPIRWYQCYHCGHWQKSRAEKQATCHRCGKSFTVRKCKKRREKPVDVDERKLGFHKYEVEE